MVGQDFRGEAPAEAMQILSLSGCAIGTNCVIFLR